MSRRFELLQPVGSADILAPVLLFVKGGSFIFIYVADVVWTHGRRSCFGSRRASWADGGIV